MFFHPSKILLLATFPSFFVACDPVVVDKSNVTLTLFRHFEERQGSTAESTASFGIVQTTFRYLWVYSTIVGLGYPPSFYNLLVDVGSSNTWVGGGAIGYQVSLTTIQTGNNVSVNYVPGRFEGREYLDQLILTETLFVSQQGIGASRGPYNLYNLDGVFGLGPVDLTKGTLSPDSQATVPTVTDNLFAQGRISKNQIGIFLQPYGTLNGGNGEISWGDPDPTRYVGKITYVPITTKYPGNQFWGFRANILYGGSTLLNKAVAVLDSGSPLIYMATDAFNTYQSVTGCVHDTATGLFSISSSQYSNLRSLSFIIGGRNFELTANAQIIPRSINTALGGTASSIYLAVKNIAQLQQGVGTIDLIVGVPFLERYYSVYDTANHQVGLAPTLFTHATTN